VYEVAKRQNVPGYSPRWHYSCLAHCAVDYRSRLLHSTKVRPHVCRIQSYDYLFIYLTLRALYPSLRATRSFSPFPPTENRLDEKLCAPLSHRWRPSQPSRAGLGSSPGIISKGGQFYGCRPREETLSEAVLDLKKDHAVKG
jgi:hypothetical protein